ncbi:MAG: DegV family protein, partial [Ktedonobacterales bacterium]|nr:DegV family protein [Ktedonobacterales bacterium]
TLGFLQRGGRIGRGKAMLGTLLNVKPLLEIRDSQVVPLEQVRTRNKALERLGQIMAKLGPLEAVGVIQSDDTMGAQVMNVARSLWNGPVETFALGPAVGTHAGPGAGGMVAIVRE